MGLLAIVPFAALNVFIALFARRFVATRLGLTGVTFWPSGDARRQPAVPWRHQTLVVVAALVPAYPIAVVLFAVALVLGGEAIPVEELSAVIDPIPDRPAAEAGMRSGDRIVAVGDRPIAGWSDLPSALAPHAGETVAVRVDRSGTEQALDVRVDEQGHIGVHPLEAHRDVGFGAALAQSVARPPLVAARWLHGTWTWIVGGVDTELGGPVAIVREVERQSADARLAMLFTWLGFADTVFGLPAAVLAGLFLRLREPSRDHHG